MVGSGTLPMGLRSTLLVLAIAGEAFGQAAVIHEVTEESSAFDWLGYTMDAAGDVDGDGWMDVFVGIPRYNPSGAAWPNGAVGIYSGFDGSRLSLVVGPTFSSIGYALRSAGDVDGDGVVDFVVGGYPQDLIRVHSGKTGALLAEFTGGVIDDQFGWSVDVAGDVDADGELDFIGGGPIYQAAGGLHQIGSCRVVSGQTGADLHVHHGSTQTAHLGWSVAGVGDVDQDGFDDYGVGIPGDPTGGGFAAGAVEVRSGSSGATLQAFFGDAPGERLGSQAYGAGDASGDGFPDLLVVGLSANNTIHDQVRMYDGQSGALLWKMKKKFPDEEIVHAAPFLDFDGDGHDDILVSQGSPPDGPSNLRVTIVSGQDMSEIGQVAGPSGERFGWAATYIGDVNGNGLDLAVGSYLAPGSGKLSILSSTLGTITKTGAPCQSSLGADASIDLDGTPTPGGEVSLFALSGEFEPTVAALFLGATGTAVPAGNGCTLYVGPPHVVLFLPTDEFGRIDYAFDTPVTFPLGAIHVQAFFADAKTPVGFTATAGRVIDFQ